MDRKWKSGASITPPTLDNASDGYATAGNPGLGVPASKPGPHWFHSVTEEILALITAAGLTPDKTSVVQLLGAANLLYDSQGIDPGGRLTLTTAVSVTNTDVSGATTTRYTPHMHDRVKLYDGTRWKWYAFTEMSQTLADTTKSPAASAATKNYDKFVWDDAATLRCTRGPLWDTGGGSNVIRGTGAGSTELEFFGGRWVNKFAITNGPAARRGLYVGTIGTNAANTVDDAVLFRGVWNSYNRVPRLLYRAEGVTTWTYNTGVYRQANANTANEVGYVCGMLTEPVWASARSHLASSIGAAMIGTTGVGVDSTAADFSIVLSGFGAAAAVGVCSEALYKGFPGLGRHRLTWLENGLGIGGTTTWTGSASDGRRSGIVGEVYA